MAELLDGPAQAPEVDETAQTPEPEAAPVHEQTPEEIINLIKPDIHVKGGDYTEDSLPEAKIVRSYGGRVVIMPTLEGRSTTSIIERSQK